MIFLCAITIACITEGCSLLSNKKVNPVKLIKPFKQVIEMGIINVLK